MRWIGLSAGSSKISSSLEETEVAFAIRFASLSFAFDSLPCSASQTGSAVFLEKGEKRKFSNWRIRRRVESYGCQCWPV